MGSTRLPGKVLMDLAGEPMLARVVSRVQRASTITEVVVATTTEGADDAIASLCVSRGWPCFRGSQDDVLDRYYRAAMAFGADVVVRITSDCPLIDPQVVDQVTQTFLDRQPGLDCAVAGHSFPRGLNTEVLRFDALERAWREDTNPAWREHVTPYVYRHPDRFTVLRITNERDLSHLRWTVDTREDLTLVRRIYECLGHDRFSWREVLAMLEKHPDWCEINSHVKQKQV
jgi:spore coat polysaccharide biosynthesis protein SpsF